MRNVVIEIAKKNKFLKKNNWQCIKYHTQQHSKLTWRYNFHVAQHYNCFFGTFQSRIIILKNKKIPSNEKKTRGIPPMRSLPYINSLWSRFRHFQKSILPFTNFPLIFFPFARLLYSRLPPNFRFRFRISQQSWSQSSQFFWHNLILLLY